MRREVWTLKSIVSGEVVAQFIVEADPVRDEPKTALTPPPPNDPPSATPRRSAR